MSHASTNPKVSVCVITYNQMDYIGQCLQSLVDQQTTFNFEVIVGDDCSSDGTQAIVQGFVDRYPQLVRAIFQASNTGGNGNYLAVHEAAQGEYVAHVDGDDYALPGKLQAQADVLDSQPDCNVVWHPVDTLSADGALRGSYAASAGRPPLVFSRQDQINFIVIGAHSSKMYRAGACPSQFHEVDFTDFFLNVTHIGSGHGILLRDRSYGVHRVGIGLSSSGHRTRKILIDNLDLLLQTEPQSRQAVNSAILHLLLSDIKRRSPTLPGTLSLFLRSFSLGGVGNYLRTFARRKALVL